MEISNGGYKKLKSHKHNLSLNPQNLHKELAIEVYTCSSSAREAGTGRSSGLDDQVPRQACVSRNQVESD